MKNKIKFIFLILILTSCRQNEAPNFNSSYEDFLNYIESPNSSDIECIESIEKAKKDVANGKIVFTQEVGFLYGMIRYENELKDLCKNFGLQYDIELISDVIIVGQTQGCYGFYMDKVIIEKFGIDFKKKMHKRADSLFLMNAIDRTVYYGNLDERSRLPNEENRLIDDLGFVYFDNPKIKLKSEKWDDLPFMDIGFIVHKDSTVSNFSLNNFVLKGNDKFKTELYNLAISKIKTDYSTWVPGSINGISLESDNNIRIHFKRKK